MGSRTEPLSKRLDAPEQRRERSERWQPWGWGPMGSRGWGPASNKKMLTIGPEPSGRSTADAESRAPSPDQYN